MRILIADDDPINRHLLERLLNKWGDEAVIAKDGREAWDILQSHDGPPLAILDWMMPGMDGIQVCRELRQHGVAPYVYCILLTTKFQKSDVIAGLDAGADDYLTKPYDPNELKARVRAGKRIVELQVQLRRAYDQLHFEATHDPLTGLASRAAVLEILTTELARAQRQGTTVGVLMADLDHFKHVNDTYGHPAGDVVLREVAKRMSSSVRPYDVVGRYGGEEFLIVAPGCDYRGALNLAEGLRAAVGKELTMTPEGMIPITLSLGVAVAGGAKPPNVEWLLKAADEALYRAKNAGRNRVNGLPEASLPRTAVRQTARPDEETSESLAPSAVPVEGLRHAVR